MSEEHDARIVLRPGNLIDDVPENQPLLRQIMATQPLSQVALTELATFYKLYPTNESLGNHLVLSFICFFLDQHIDANEDYCNGMDPNDPEDARELGQVGKVLATREHIVRPVDIKWVSVSGIGLLVETSKIAGIDKLQHFIIGVSPNPANL
jgi:hypothetical protein